MKRAFLGANAAAGFVNLFNQVVPDSSEYRLYILKGGSGCGKSTLMKKVIEFASAMGMTADSYFCSGDVTSLDGIYIPEVKTAIIDGTAPHMTDPKAYGAHGEIINMGDCIRSDEMRGDYARISDVMKKKRALYDTAYTYLGAAGKIFEDCAKKNAACCDDKTIKMTATQIVKKLGVRKRALKETCHRKMFVSAFTPQGYSDFSGDYLSASKTYILSGAFDSVCAEVLMCLLPELACRFTEIDCFMHPLIAGIPFGIYLKDVDVFIVTETFLREEYKEGERIDLSCLVKKEVDAICEKEKNDIRTLCDSACERIKNAFELHGAIEEIYKPHIEFEKANAKINDVITRIQQ